MVRGKAPVKGTTVLRGGKGNYKSRTLIGNWEEDREIAPPLAKFGGVETTKTAAEAEVVNAKRVLFGRGIQPPGYKLRSTIHYQDEDATGKPTSITRLSQDAASTAFRDEFGSRFPLRPPRRLTKQELLAYRDKWSADLTGRAERFVTEKTSYQNKAVPAHFELCQMRKLPNVPVLIQNLQERLTTCHGPHALHLLRKVFRCYDADSNGHLSEAELQELFRDLDLKLSHDEMQAIFTFLDYDNSGSIEADELVKVLSGGLSATRLAAVLEAWDALDAERAGFVFPGDLLAQFRLGNDLNTDATSSLWREIAAQFPKQWDVYLSEFEAKGDGDEETVTRAEFIEYYERLSPAIRRDKDFAALLAGSWPSFKG